MPSTLFDQASPDETSRTMSHDDDGRGVCRAEWHIVVASLSVRYFHINLPSKYEAKGRVQSGIRKSRKVAKQTFGSIYQSAPRESVSASRSRTFILNTWLKVVKRHLCRPVPRRVQRKRVGRLPGKTCYRGPILDGRGVVPGKADTDTGRVARKRTGPESQPGPDNALPCIFYVAEWQQPRGHCVFQQHQCQDDIDQSRKTPSRAWLGVLRL
jgi:hypothetical protein